MKKSLAFLGAALLSLSVLAASSTPKGFTDDLDAALRRAAENGRRVVAVFSGSDWCGWCKELDKKILSKEAFLKVATNTYELVYIDNPMDTKVLSETGRKNNRRITEKYGVKGFPTVLVLAAKGAEVATVSGYDGESGPEGYLKMLESEIRDAPDVKKYIRPIEDILNRHDKEMESDMEAIGKEIAEKFQKHVHSFKPQNASEFFKFVDFVYCIVCCNNSTFY